MRTQFYRVFRPAMLIFPLALVQWKPVHAVGRKQKRFSDALHESFDKREHHYEDFHKHAILLSGTANPELAQEIAEFLKTSVGNVKTQRFADGEVNIQITDNVRGKDIFILQPTCTPVNDNLMELLLLVSALRRASARKINVVVPYCGYSKPDRKTSGADVARLIENVGVDRVIAVDLHRGQIQGFFGPRVPVDNLEANLVAINYLKHQDQFTFKNVVIVSPDAEGVARAKIFKDQLQSTEPSIEVDLAIVVKQQASADRPAIINLVGDVHDKDVIIVDDVIDTALTICDAANLLKDNGARRVLAFATHAVFSGNALQNISDSQIDQIIVTNTIPPKPLEELLGNKLYRLSVAPLLAEAIYRIQMKDSVTNLFRVLPTIRKD